MSKKLIVNADDYGQNNDWGVPEGILLAHKDGIVTSTSVLVNYVTKEQVKQAKETSLGLGLHVQKDPRRELTLFQDLFGENPTHMDSHRFLMYEREHRLAFYNLAQEVGMPIRKAALSFKSVGDFKLCFKQIVMPKGLRTTDYAVFTPIKDEESLLGVLHSLKEGSTEVMCHVSLNPNNKNGAMKRQLEIMTSPRVKKTIIDQGIKLITFKDL
jgi:predicted glycoside hydrolase/deacetylase ChbG (UPF0249 family)